MFNFLKAARDPETASPGAEDPGAGRAGEPSQSPPRPHNPRLRVGATWALPAAAWPAPEGGWAGAAGSAESAEIENRRHSRRIEASGAATQLGDTLPPASAGAPADAPHPACWAGGRDSGVQSRAEGGCEARSFVRWDRAGRRGAGGQPGAVRGSPQNPAPRRPRSPPRGPATASASPLWPEARRPQPGARKLRVPRAWGGRGGRGGGAAGLRRGWLDELPVELGAQAPWGPGLGVLVVWGRGL